MIESEQLRIVYNEFIDKTNGLYLNIMELIVFNENNNTKIDADIINLLMELITESRFKSIEYAVKDAKATSELIFEIKPQYCSLLLQILYKNSKETVKLYLDVWFKKQETSYRDDFKANKETN